jgi:hypothetical protein
VQREFDRGSGLGTEMGLIQAIMIGPRKRIEAIAAKE